MKKRILRSIAALALCLSLILGVSPVQAAVRFVDVPANNWAAEAISRGVELGLFKGETESRFGLGHTMTRAAFVVTLDRLFGWDSEGETAGQLPLKDVSPEDWFYAALSRAFAHDVITRQSDAFRPGDPVTREEVAVLLVRALGYGTIAGLAQELSVPFRDLDTNKGYIAAAYHLGITKGTAAHVFSPETMLTREQAAVTLLRVYDQLHPAAPARVGIADSTEDLTDLTGYDAVIIPACRMVHSGKLKVNVTMDRQQLEAVTAAVRAAGVKCCLGVRGSANALKAAPLESAVALAEAVTEGGYDGLYLDIPHVPAAQCTALTSLCRAVDKQLGGLELYLAAEAPDDEGRTGGYDYPALSGLADRLVVQVAPGSRVTEDHFPIAPQEPVEDVFTALAALTDRVPADKLSLMLTTTGSAWNHGKQTGTLSARQVENFLKADGTEEFYSDRYACAYLIATSQTSQTVAWYLSGEAAAARVRTAGFFGVDQLCLSDLTSVSPEVDAVLRGR